MALRILGKESNPINASSNARVLYPNDDIRITKPYDIANKTSKKKKKKKNKVLRKTFF